MNKHKRAGIVFLVLVLASVFSAWAIAGDLEPSADPAPTMHSLEGIYNLLEDIYNLQIANFGSVPVSGQTSSYATGGDGDLQKGITWPDPRFTDNGDGTVTDNLTGLIWLQDANRESTMDWAAALAYCNSLADDGSDLTDGSVAGDWRLPNVRELQSLIDYGNESPALPTGHPFSSVQSTSYYWSSTTRPNYTDRVWRVYMQYGSVLSYDKSGSYYVWPVRGDN
jgi:hypothetical protein